MQVNHLQGNAHRRNVTALLLAPRSIFGHSYQFNFFMSWWTHWRLKKVQFISFRYGINHIIALQQNPSQGTPTKFLQVHNACLSIRIRVSELGLGTASSVLLSYDSLLNLLGKVFIKATNKMNQIFTAENGKYEANSLFILVKFTCHSY